MDSAKNSLYDVYCHFNSDGAWTLVQSYSFANKSLHQIKKPLSDDAPVSEEDLTWSGYRLREPRMRSIKDNSSFLQLTCDYEKHHDIEQSDYVQIPLEDIKKSSQDVDFLELSGYTSYTGIGGGRGKIGEHDLNHCKIKFHQDTNWPLHVHIKKTVPECKFNKLSHCYDISYNYFGDYYSRTGCGHGCVQNHYSTTQLWFGIRKGSTAQPPHV